jgi:hypothetical protein
MGYGYNPIVGKNWRYNPEKTFKISRSKIAKDDQKCLAWSGDFDPLEVE